MMFSSDARVFTLLVLVLLLPPLASAQPDITDVRFEQLDWYGYDGTEIVLVDENSSWGSFACARDAVAELWYLNLGVALTEDGERAWMVQNFPLFPDAFCDGPCRHMLDLDLTQLGLSPGDDLAGVYFATEVVQEPAAGPPAGGLTFAEVTNRDRRPPNWPIKGDTYEKKKVGAPAGHKAGAAKIENVTPPRDMPGVQEDPDGCFAGSCARSIAWLDKEYGLGIGKSAQEIYDDLVAAGCSKKNGEQSVQEPWINAKAKYLDESGKGGVTKVWDSAEIFGDMQFQRKDQQTPVPIPRAGGEFLGTFFLPELLTGEDVELAYRNTTGAHIVTVLRVFKQGGKTFVEYRDDNDGQGDPDTGDKEPKTAEIGLSNGVWVFGGANNVIHFAVSESPKREPSAGGDGKVTWVDPKGGASSSGRPPIKVNLKKGGETKFWWTVNGLPHYGYKPFVAKGGDKDTELLFVPPKDFSVTDWGAEIKRAKGTAQVTGARIEKHSPWRFYVLQELPPISYRAPALAPTEDAFESTIYTAINLGLYMSSNPEGPMDGKWQVGQTLDEIGVEIVDGRIPGIEGIYFATTELIFDPGSEFGWIPSTGDAGWLDSERYQSEHGPILIINQFVSLESPPHFPADLNCDGLVDFNDIDPFVTALISREDYETGYPNCNWFNADINEDESVDFDDIDPFVECLINNGCQ